MTRNRKLVIGALFIVLLCTAICFDIILSDLNHYKNGFLLKGTYMTNGTPSIENKYLVFLSEREGSVFYYYKQFGNVEEGSYAKTEHSNLYKSNSDIAGILDCTFLVDKESVYVINSENVIRYEKISDIPTFISAEPPQKH